MAFSGRRSAIRSPTTGNGSNASANSTPDRNPLPLQPDELVASRVSHANHPATRRLSRSTTKIAHANERLLIVWFLRSEEHTSELQSLTNLVCRLLLEKKKYRKRK